MPQSSMVEVLPQLCPAKMDGTWEVKQTWAVKESPVTSNVRGQNICRRK